MNEQDKLTHETPRKRMIHPVLMMLVIMLVAMALTYLVDSGAFERAGKLVVPGTYQVWEKPIQLANLWSSVIPSAANTAAPASFLTVLMAIPQGMAKSAPLIVMVMFIGGMFGILRRTGALDAGIERLLALTKGNVYWITILLMLALAVGSTFLGLISEYLVVIPLMVALAQRLKLPSLFALAVVAVAAKIGYLASITNPLALAVAQPLVDVPILSGMSMRVGIFIVYLTLGIGYVLWFARKSGFSKPQDLDLHFRLSKRHVSALLVLLVSVAVLMLGTKEWKWGNVQISAFYIVVAAVIAIVSKMPSRQACEAFIEGMQGMVLAGVLIGLAESVHIILVYSHVMDTVIYQLSSLVQGHSPTVAGQGMVVVQMILDILIPSTSGKAAVSMPILGPIGQLAGLSGQSVVLAFLFGNGLMNMLTPTSGMLLAYLATAKVEYGTWVRFILPLWILLALLSFVCMALAIAIGY